MRKTNSIEADQHCRRYQVKFRRCHVNIDTSSLTFATYTDEKTGSDRLENGQRSRIIVAGIYDIRLSLRMVAADSRPNPLAAPMGLWRHTHDSFEVDSSIAE